MIFDHSNFKESSSDHSDHLNSGDTSKFSHLKLQIQMLRQSQIQGKPTWLTRLLRSSVRLLGGSGLGVGAVPEALLVVGRLRLGNSE